jgi:hypothetical protein
VIRFLNSGGARPGEPGEPGDTTSRSAKDHLPPGERRLNRTALLEERAAVTATTPVVREVTPRARDF